MLMLFAFRVAALTNISKDCSLVVPAANVMNKHGMASCAMTFVAIETQDGKLQNSVCNSYLAEHVICLCLPMSIDVGNCTGSNEISQSCNNSRAVPLPNTLFNKSFALILHKCTVLAILGNSVKW